MLFNAIVLLLAAFITYMWVIRGFFSALIHLVCTVIAGAVAYGVWEPVSYWILESAPTSGVASHFAGMAWGVGLIVPFAITLAVLRLAVDQMLPANVVLNQRLNYVGGGVCGLAAGVLTAGLVSTGLTYFRMPGFGTSVRYSSGNVVRESPLWVPVDKMANAFFGMASERAFRTSEPLAKWHPYAHEEGGTLQLAAFEGKNRNTTRLGDFEVLGRFTIGEPGKANFKNLLSDMWQPAAQKVSDLDGREFPANSHIEMFVVNFKPGAKEKDGKVSVGAAQVRLLLENDDDERMTVHPIAVSSQAQSDKEMFGRWRYDAPDTFIASVGGGSEAVFAFEFPCPPGYRPLALYIKGARHLVDSPSTAKPKATLRSAAERDGLIVSGMRTAGVGAAVTDLDTSTATKVVYPKIEGQQKMPPVNMRVTDTLNFIIQKGTHDQLEIDEEQKNLILNGEVTLPIATKNNTRGIEKNLVINRLQSATDQVVVQIDSWDATQFSMMIPEFMNQDGDAPPTLYDSNNTPYVPVGYAYEDETKLTLRYTPGNPIAKMSDLPRLSKSRPAQRLTLIYRVSRGVKITSWGCGKKIVKLIDPPYQLD